LTFAIEFDLQKTFAVEAIRSAKGRLKDRNDGHF